MKSLRGCCLAATGSCHAFDKLYSLSYTCYLPIEDYSLKYGKLAPCSSGTVMLASMTLSLSVVTQVTVSASGEFQVQLKSFVNDLRITEDGRCCGGAASAISESIACVESCRTFFRICLSNYQAKLVPSQALCRFGETTTPVLDDKQLRGFTGKNPRIESAGTPFVDGAIRLPFDFTWPVKLLIYYRETTGVHLFDITILQIIGFRLHVADLYRSSLQRHLFN